MKITASNSKIFIKAEKMLSCFNETFLKMFQTCETETIVHGILKLTSSEFYFNKEGFALPENAKDIKITESEQAVNVIAAFEKGSTRFVLSLYYPTKERKCNFFSIDAFKSIDKYIEAWKEEEK